MSKLTARDFWKAIGIGIATALVLSAIAIAGQKTGISPLPKPLALAFAQTLLGPGVTLPIGLAFHVAWVTLFSVVYIAWSWHRLTFLRALGLAAVLWIATLVVFFPFVGWGFFGLAVSPMLIPGSAAPHLLFAIILWALSRMAFRHEQPVAIAARS